MWFKNAQVYRLKTPFNLTKEALVQQLARGGFFRCPSNQPMSRGWASPRGDGDLVYAQNRQWLIRLQIEERVMPAGAVNDAVTERALAIADQQGYPPGRKQLKEIKERVVEELLPRAMTKKRSTFAWIDPENGWFVVDAGSTAKAEEVIEHLRRCLDELPLAMLHTTLSPTSAMADWLAGCEAPPGFTVDRDCELKSLAEEKAAVRYVRHPLSDAGYAEEIKAHLAAGKLPTRLALTWDDRISFVLTEKLEVKRMAFLDLLKEQAEENAKRADEQFDADFALMTGELQRFLPQLVDALGGEVQENA